MKNSLFYCLIIFLVLASFKFKSDFKDINEGEILPIAQTADTLPDCFSSYQIYTETAFLWQASWVSYNNYKGGLYRNSPRVSFDAQSLISLYNEVDKREVNQEDLGILMWYTLLDPNDSIPLLAIQNTVDCNIDPEGTILLAAANDPTSTVSAISPAYLELIKSNWDSLGRSNPAVYTDISAYNYEWESILDLMTVGTGQQGINIRYGLRTIEPDDAANYATSADPDKTGSIIYCNVLYGHNFEVDPSATLLDFAMPCPIYCGNN